MTALFLFHSTKANHMSKIKSGILGPYSGTIGSVTGYRRNGKNIIQAKKIYTPPTIIDNLLTNNNKMEWAWINAKYYSKVIFNLMNRYETGFSVSMEEIVKLNFQKIDLSNPRVLKCWTLRNLEKDFSDTSTNFIQTSPTAFTHSVTKIYRHWKYYNWNTRRSNLINSPLLNVVGSPNATPINTLTDAGGYNAQVAPNYRLYFFAAYNTSLLVPCLMIMSGRVNTSVP